MEGGHGGIELPGHGAHRGRADRAAEHRQERGDHLAGRQPQGETRQDHAVDILGALAWARTTLSALQVRVRGAASSMSPSSVSRRRSQPLRRSAWAASGHALEVLIAFEQRDQGLAGAAAIVLAPLDAFGLHGLHHPKRAW
jgi:hypothetical protein